MLIYIFVAFCTTVIYFWKLNRVERAKQTKDITSTVSVYSELHNLQCSKYLGFSSIGIHFPLSISCRCCCDKTQSFNLEENICFSKKKKKKYKRKIRKITKLLHDIFSIKRQLQVFPKTYFRSLNLLQEKTSWVTSIVRCLVMK